MYFSKNEQPIIENFYKNITKIKEGDILSLIWENGQVEAIFDTCFDDFNEENEEDEYTSFSFILRNESKGFPPIKIMETKYFIINYHNFPKDIFLNGEKIN